MEPTATDYKTLYEELLLTLAKNQEVIADLHFELDKFRKYFFGKKSEKFPHHKQLRVRSSFLSWAPPKSSSRSCVKR